VVKKLLGILSIISILGGPMIYLSIMNQVGRDGALPNVNTSGKGLSGWLETAADKLPDLGGADSGGPVQVYKWKGASGVWQFSSEPPPQMKGAELVTITTNSSLPAFKQKGQAAPEQPQEKAAENGEALNLIPTPGRVEKLIEDAKNVQNLVDEHARQIEAATQ
jgi:hypothetical protein